MKIYILTTCEYDTFSYEGISDSDRYYFTTREKAEKRAEELGLKIVEYATDPNNHATIAEEEVE